MNWIIVYWIVACLCNEWSAGNNHACTNHTWIQIDANEAVDGKLVTDWALKWQIIDDSATQILELYVCSFNFFKNKLGRRVTTLLVWVSPIAVVHTLFWSVHCIWFLSNMPRSTLQKLSRAEQHVNLISFHVKQIDGL